MAFGLGASVVVRCSLWGGFVFRGGEICGGLVWFCLCRFLPGQGWVFCDSLPGLLCHGFFRVLGGSGCRGQTGHKRGGASLAQSWMVCQVYL